ncbi:UNVERIFIED_CONTAM: hypothetical protein GTU68_032762 [Idotea baltica]|nr:hypothetical protein [Idotea baltica]
MFLENIYEWNEPVISVTKQQVRSWIASLVNEGKSATSVRRKLSTLKSFFKYQQQQGIIENNPANNIATPKIPKRLPKTVNTNSLNNLLEKHYFGDGFAGMRDKLVIELIYETGMRLSEITNLKTLNVYLNEKVVRVTGKGNKERIIPFSNLLKQNIQQYLSVRATTTFENPDFSYFIVTNKGKRTYSKLISRIVNKYLTLITTNEHKHPHVLRHTYASALLNNGADLNAIKELLGHSSLAATQVYTHNSAEQLKKIYFLTHPKS